MASEAPKVNPQIAVVYVHPSTGVAKVYSTGYDIDQASEAVAYCEELYGDVVIKAVENAPLPKKAE